MMAHSLNLLQVLEALVSECELCLDRRAPFKRAMSNAYTAIAQAKAAAPAPELHGSVALKSIETSEAECELTFRDLFGEPDPQAYDPKVTEAARLIATDGAVAPGAARFLGMVEEGGEQFAHYSGVAL